MNIPFLLKKQYTPLNRITISKSALLHNYRYLTSLVPNMQIAPVLKSNAYGHGITLIASLLDSVGAPFICVDSLFEAYTLLKMKIRTPILIMGYVDPQNLAVKKVPFSFAVYDYETLAGILKYQPQARVHIFIDTGMHREGVRFDELESFIDSVKKFPGINIEGIMSHFGESESPEKIETKEQVQVFQQAIALFHQADIYPKWIHIANSSGILQNRNLGDLGNMARTGLALFGIDPERRNMKLQPVLQVETTLHQVKSLRKGEKVGYGFTYTAVKNMTIGILPIGYSDGINLQLSNSGFVKIGDRYCPIIGQVSMNLTTIDLSDIENPHIGQNVIVFSNYSGDKNSIQQAAALKDTISYTLLTGLQPSTKRIVIT